MDQGNPLTAYKALLWLMLWYNAGGFMDSPLEIVGYEFDNKPDAACVIILTSLNEWLRRAEPRRCDLYSLSLIYLTTTRLSPWTFPMILYLPMIDPFWYAAKPVDCKREEIPSTPYGLLFAGRGIIPTVVWPIRRRSRTNFPPQEYNSYGVQAMMRHPREIGRRLNTAE